VRSGGLRIEVIYLRGPAAPHPTGTVVSDPICWTCVRARSLGAGGIHEQWRAATARFLNELRASDPDSYYCGIRSLSSQ
jgi:hypothetical protein